MMTPHDTTPQWRPAIGKNGQPCLRAELHAPVVAHVTDGIDPRTLRTPRQSAGLVRYQHQQRAAWLDAPADRRAARTDAVLTWAAIAIAVLTFALAHLPGASDAQAQADTEADLRAAIAQAQQDERGRAGAN